MGDVTRPTTVYRYFDKDDRLLYVGITSHGELRAAQHARIAEWWCQISHARYVHHPSRADAIAEEARAIATEGPLFNRVSLGRSPSNRAWKLKRVLPPPDTDPALVSAEIAVDKLLRTLRMHRWPDL
jgi:hypothetical protein